MNNSCKKELILKIILMAVLSGLLSAQGYIPTRDSSIDYGDWRISDEPLSFNKVASLTHSVGSAYLANVFDDKMPWWQADIMALSAGLLWETKDGYVPWEKADELGGEGFSFNDLGMDALGIAINRMLQNIIFKTNRVSQTSGEQKLFSAISNQSYQAVLISMEILTLAGLELAQDNPRALLNGNNITNVNVSPDKLVLRMIGPAYLARVFDNYMPWWKSDLLAFSSAVVWEINDRLIPEEDLNVKQPCNSISIKYGALGIVLNRALPVIVQGGINMAKLSFKSSYTLGIDARDHLKLKLSLDIG